MQNYTTTITIYGNNDNNKRKIMCPTVLSVSNMISQKLCRTNCGVNGEVVY